MSYLPHNRTAHKVIQQVPKEYLNDILGTMFAPGNIEKNMVLNLRELTFQQSNCYTNYK